MIFSPSLGIVQNCLPECNWANWRCKERTRRRLSRRRLPAAAKSALATVISHYLAVRWCAKAVRALRVFDGRDELRERTFGVTEQKRRLGVVEQLVLDAGEAGVHAALEHDNALGLVGVED